MEERFSCENVSDLSISKSFVSTVVQTNILLYSILFVNFVLSKLVC